MKYFFLFLFISSYLHIFISSPVRADFDRSYQDYLYQTNQYRQSLTSFLTAKNRYLTYKTLVTQNEALDATKSFLTARDQLLLVYLQMLLQKNPEDVYQKLLNQELTFYQNHKESISALASLNDTVTSSSKIKDHYPQTEVLARQISLSLITAKLQNLLDRQKTLISDFEQLTKTLRGQDSDTSVLERWFLSIKNKELLTEQKISEIKNLTDKLEPKESNRLTEDYGKIQVLIFETNQYLKEANAFIKELKEEMKYGKY